MYTKLMNTYVHNCCNRAVWQTSHAICKMRGEAPQYINWAVRDDGFFWPFLIKLGYSEKATKFEKIFHLKFDATQ